MSRRRLRHSAACGRRTWGRNIDRQIGVSRVEGFSPKEGPNERTRRSGARARDDRRGSAGIDRGGWLVGGREDAGSQLQRHAEDRDHHAADGRRRASSARSSCRGRGTRSRRSPGRSGSRSSSCSATRRSRRGRGEGLVVAQKMIADSRLVAVIGPATSARRGVEPRTRSSPPGSRTSRPRRRARR